MTGRPQAALSACIQTWIRWRSPVPPQWAAICRGLHVINVASGGTLDQDIPGHKHVIHPVKLAPDSTTARILRTDETRASCYHHQRIDRLGTGLVATVWAADGTVEAVDLPDAPGWFAAVQWHPEDIAAQDQANQALFDALVIAAVSRQ